MLEFDLIDSLQEIERYLNIPVVTVEETIALARALLEVETRFECEPVLDAGAELERELRVTQALFAESRAELDLVQERREVAIEDLTDRLWTSLLKILHGWKAFLHPGLESAASEGEHEAELAQAREQARRALILCESLFPAEEFGFVIHPPFHEQAQTLEAFVRLCEDPEWSDAEQLAGEHMLPLMKLIQRQHQTLISCGQWRRRQGTELGLQRAKLRRRIGRYNNVVVAQIDEQAPDKLRIIKAMLAPVDALIEGLKAPSGLSPGS